ncbi:MAG: hypothetical protein JWO79_672 [Actinomycetia bacterium]|nr:hypothetical protein [Actinomycetes bacterium]MDQ1655333.1 hypothetical protein [Cryptosporangiaceae bacterium]
MTTDRATPLLTRVASWALDLRGDAFGDERERLRRYEGIVLGANLQLGTVPIAAAALVWAGGRPLVPPLALLMVLFYLPVLVSAGYLRSRHAAGSPGRNTRKKVSAALLGTVPLVVFAAGCVWPYRSAGAVAGALGGVAAGLVLVLVGRLRRPAPGGV